MIGIGKLKNKNGVSFLIALLFFLICGLAGSAILSISRSYGRYAATKPNRVRERLALMSAMEFMKGQLELCSGFWDLEFLEENTENGFQGQLLKELEEFCDKYSENPYGAVQKRIVNISLEDGEQGEWSMPIVEAVMIFRSQDSEEEIMDEVEENRIDICVEIQFGLEEKKNMLLRMEASGFIRYEKDDYLEVWWEEITSLSTEEE